MTEQIERILRAIEDQYASNPQYRKGVTHVRRALYEATELGEFPFRVPEPVIEEREIYLHPEFEFYVEDALLVSGEKRASLTATENRIFLALVRNPNRIMSRKRLATRLRSGIQTEPIDVDEKTINVHISKIRGKLKSINGELNPIETIKGMGYRLIDPSLDSGLELTNYFNVPEPEV